MKTLIIIILLIIIFVQSVAAAPLPPTKPGICTTPTPRPPATPTHVLVK